MNVLIIGKTSYIAREFLKDFSVNKYPEITTLNVESIKNDNLNKIDFTKYDTILYFAGVAHRNENKTEEELYNMVNNKLAFETARKAKESGVIHFVYLSSMSIFGINKGSINNQSIIAPITKYGKSKLNGEKSLQSLIDENFNLSIIRPPIVYGKGCKGNYNFLSNFASKSFLFPKVNNKRSMIYVKNLTVFIYKIISNRKFGVYHPQNSEYINTSNLAKEIAKDNNHRIYFTRLFNPLIFIFNYKLYNKVFGDLYYDMNEDKVISESDFISFEDSIKETENVH